MGRKTPRKVATKQADSKTATVHPIRKARDAANLSLRELGDRLGVDRRLIHLWEAGHRKPEKQSILRVAQALGIDQDTLLVQCGHLPDWAQSLLEEEPLLVLGALRCTRTLPVALEALKNWPTSAGGYFYRDRLQRLQLLLEGKDPGPFPDEKPPSRRTRGQSRRR